jgi:hypothetical protein
VIGDDGVPGVCSTVCREGFAAGYIKAVVSQKKDELRHDSAGNEIDLANV